MWTAGVSLVIFFAIAGSTASAQNSGTYYLYKSYNLQRSAFIDVCISLNVIVSNKGLYSSSFSQFSPAPNDIFNMFSQSQ